jgi:hypothetical protein
VRMRNIKRATVMEIGQLLTPSQTDRATSVPPLLWGGGFCTSHPQGIQQAAAGLESLVYEKRVEEKEAGRDRQNSNGSRSENRPARVRGSVAESPSRWRGGSGRATHRRDGGSDGWYDAAPGAEPQEAAALVGGRGYGTSTPEGRTGAVRGPGESFASF